MKRIALLSTILLAALSCGKSDPDEPNAPEKGTYVGTVTVVFMGAPNANENISVAYDPSADGKSASITINAIRFVPSMPVTIDVTIPEIEVTTTSSKTSLSCKSVTPLALGGEYPDYQVTDFTGTLEGEKLSFSLNFGSFPTTFSGTLKK